MKKLMFAAAAVAACVAVADVTSANVVGYVATEVPSETVYMALGPTFMDVGSEGTFTPNASMVPSNEYDWSMDKLFLVDPTSCDFVKILVYNGDGWYDEANDYAPWEEDLPAGEGFQTEFTAGNNICINFPAVLD